MTTTESTTGASVGVPDADGSDIAMESSPGPTDQGTETPDTRSASRWRQMLRHSRRALSPRRLRGRFVPAAVAVLMVAALAAAATAYFTLYRTDQATGPAPKRDVLAAANDGTIAILSYSPKTLDADFAKAKGHLTGQFLTYYNEFTAKVVKPAATENGVETKAQVVRSAVSTIDKSNAQVLAFVNQSTTSKTKPEPELTSSSVKVSLQHVDGRWQISSFDPI
jgi:Mce-associated membrane protein